MNPEPSQSSGRGKHGVLRRAFRGMRIAVLLLVLAAAVFALWCNFVRVPGFITSRVRAELRTRNIALDFSRLRLKGFRRLVAEDVRVSLLNATNAPLARMREAEIRLNRQKLRRGDLEVSGASVEGGEFEMPLAGENRAVHVTNIQAEIDFTRGDTLRLTSLSAEALGARATASGTLKNISRLHVSPAGKADGKGWEEQAAEIIRIAEQLRFETPPEISLNFSGDALNVAQTRATISLRADRTRSRWGSLGHLQLISGVYPLASNTGMKASFLFDLDRLRGISNRIEALRFSAESVWAADLSHLLTNNISLAVTNAKTRWFAVGSGAGTLLTAAAASGPGLASRLEINSRGLRAGPARAESSRATATLLHPLPFSSPAVWLARVLGGTNSIPARNGTFSGMWETESAGLKIGEAEIAQMRSHGELRPREAAPAPAPDLIWWETIAPFEVPWSASLSGITARRIDIGSLEVAGNWAFPNLAITNAAAALYGGTLQGSARLNVQNREADASVSSDFDYKKAAALFDEPVRKWLDQFAWETPPKIQSTVHAGLPEWNREWTSRAVARGIRIDGEFSGPLRFRGVALDEARSHFHFADFLWHLPDLQIARADGSARLNYTGNVTNSDFRCTIDSRLDPAALRELFPEDQQTPFEVLTFREPPLLRGEARGNWEHPERIGFAGEINATNFFVKEQALTDLRAEFLYTNQIVEARNLVAHRGKEQVTAPFLRVDIPGETMFVTNAVSTIDPWVAMSLVGDDAYDAIDPYRFAVTPTVTVNGIVPLRHYGKANIHFGVTGREFTFWKFHMPSLSGDVYWRSNLINFSNVVANFYNGDARWSASFWVDPSPKSRNAHYSFTAHTEGSDLKLLMRDVFPGTNQLEGSFTGDLVITGADTDYPGTSWNGHGKAMLKDGFLWNVPIFGVFSPILDSLIPGVSASRITSGGGSCTITNSVIYTRDMQVRAPAFRLDYKGKVDFSGNLDARVEAEILRDAWVVGKVFSMALWPLAKAFEARVTGTLDSPQTKLRYFPKFVFAPFKALNAIGEAVKDSASRPGPEPASKTDPAREDKRSK